MSKVCCFIGHRKIKVNDELSQRLYLLIKNLIEKEKVETFLFGSRSEFDDLCLETVTTLKQTYPHIQRIYIRAEFPCISEHYKDFLLEFCDDTFFPENIIKAGRAVYIERNKIMIDKSDILVMYYEENSLPKSGTKQAYNYAKKKNNMMLINVAPQKKDSTK